KAIADFSEAIRRDSQQAAYYQSRGLARALKGDHREAIADFNQAMVRMPRNAFFYFSRGRSRYKLGEYGSAIADFQQAIRINSRYAKAYDGVAWIQATCPDDAYADGRQAVANATRACELADWKDSVYIATLAAAYAESGDFEQAQQNLSRAVKMSPDAYKAKRTKMAELFAAQEPYRESPPSPTQQTNATRRPTS
ncbi:MAG: tetratricopeptide repeat protein, partial [Planctomycetota bacterium]